MNIMTIYKVEISYTAKTDLSEIMDFLRTVLSREGAHRYVATMRDEVLSLSVYANVYHPSHYADVRCFHPQACRMVSHNKRWAYIFHKEDDVVVIDRIRPTKLITK